MKMTERFDGETYRAAYVIEFPQCVYLLHVFQKKSSSGKATPKPDKDTILARWKAAKQHHRDTYGPQGGRK